MDRSLEPLAPPTNNPPGKQKETRHAERLACYHRFLGKVDDFVPSLMRCAVRLVYYVGGLPLCGGLVLALALGDVGASPGPSSQKATSSPKAPPLQHFKLALRSTTALNVGEKRFDPSGLTLSLDGRRLLLVNDKEEKIRLYGLSLQKARKGGALAPFVLWQSPQQANKGWWRRFFGRRLDLEGVTRCQRAYLVISEGMRQVFRLEPAKKRRTRHPIALKTYRKKAARRGRALPSFPTSPNASYEGIACDASHKKLYLIQERQPRLIVVARLPPRWLDGQPLTVVDHFDLPSLSLPRRGGAGKLIPDFAGAYATPQALYVLYRNARTILKVDTRQRSQPRLLAVASYGHIEKTLYRTREPYGLAEGLALQGDSIWLLFDNNGRPRQQNPRDHRPLLLRLQRPPGF